MAQRRGRALLEAHGHLEQIRSQLIAARERIADLGRERDELVAALHAVQAEADGLLYERDEAHTTIRTLTDIIAQLEAEREPS